MFFREVLVDLQKVALVHQAGDDLQDVEWDLGVGWHQVVHDRIRGQIQRRSRAVRRVHQVVGRHEAEEPLDQRDRARRRPRPQNGRFRSRWRWSPRCRSPPSCTVWPVTALMTSGPQMNMFACLLTMMMKSIRAGE